MKVAGKVVAQDVAACAAQLKEYNYSEERIQKGMARRKRRGLPLLISPRRCASCGRPSGGAAAGRFLVFRGRRCAHGGRQGPRRSPSDVALVLRGSPQYPSRSRRLFLLSLQGVSDAKSIWRPPDPCEQHAGAKLRRGSPPGSGRLPRRRAWPSARHRLPQKPRAPPASHGGDVRFLCFIWQTNCIVRPPPSGDSARPTARRGVENPKVWAPDNRGPPPGPPRPARAPPAGGQNPACLILSLVSCPTGRQPPPT